MDKTLNGIGFINFHSYSNYGVYINSEEKFQTFCFFIKTHRE